MSKIPDLIPGLFRSGRETASDGMIQAELGDRNSYNVSVVGLKRFNEVLSAHNDGLTQGLATIEIIKSQSKRRTTAGYGGRTHFVFDTPIAQHQPQYEASSWVADHYQPTTPAEIAATLESFRGHIAALAITKSGEAVAEATPVQEPNMLNEKTEQNLKDYLEAISGFRDADVDAAFNRVVEYQGMASSQAEADATFDQIMTFNDMQQASEDPRMGHGLTR